MITVVYEKSAIPFLLTLVICGVAHRIQMLLDVRPVLYLDLNEVRLIWGEVETFHGEQGILRLILILLL